jgi:hypothetical protein
MIQYAGYKMESCAPKKNLNPEKKMGATFSDSTTPRRFIRWHQMVPRQKKVVVTRRKKNIFQLH